MPLLPPISPVREIKFTRPSRMASHCKRFSVLDIALLADRHCSTSPSVYVDYTALRATVTCGESSLQTIGPSHAEKTIGYSSRFLAFGTVTSPNQRCEDAFVVDGFQTIDFTSLYYTPVTTSTTQKAGCPPYVNPRLSLPAELTDVHPSWKSCEPLFYGAFDPPKQSGKLVPSHLRLPSRDQSQRQCLIQSRLRLQRHWQNLPRFRRQHRIQPVYQGIRLLLTIRRCQ